MLRLFTSPRRMVGSLIEHRNLIVALTVREVLGRYRGSVLGLFWSVFQPILMLAVYTFVFGLIFRSRWPGGSGSRSEFALVLFSGLLVFNMFAECLNRAPTIILSNTNYVKRVVFPLEVLPCVTVAVALFHLFVSFIVWLVFYLIAIGIPSGNCLVLFGVGRLCAGHRADHRLGNYRVDVHDPDFLPGGGHSRQVPCNRRAESVGADY
jgi:lipopolysaccharide transport system permease protein